MDYFINYSNPTKTLYNESNIGDTSELMVPLKKLDKCYPENKYLQIKIKSLAYDESLKIFPPNYMKMLPNTNLAISPGVSEYMMDEFYKYLKSKKTHSFQSDTYWRSTVYIDNAILIPLHYQLRILVFIEKTKKLPTEQHVINLLQEAINNTDYKIVPDIICFEESKPFRRTLNKTKYFISKYYKIYMKILQTNNNMYSIESVNNPGLNLFTKKTFDEKTIESMDYDFRYNFMETIKTSYRDPIKMIVFNDEKRYEFGYNAADHNHNPRIVFNDIKNTNYIKNIVI